MRIVAEQRHIGEDRHGDSHGDDQCNPEDAAGDSQAHRNLQAGGKQHHQREDDAGEPAQIDQILDGHRCSSPQAVRKSAKMIGQR